jgi:hypothetical protein
MAFFARPLELTFGSELVIVGYGWPPNSCSFNDNVYFIFKKYGNLLGGKRSFYKSTPTRKW